MAKKYIVKEGILSKFVGALTKNIIDKKRQKNAKALKNDPKLRKLEDELAKKMKDLESYVSNKTGMTDDEFLDKLK